jgi:hypothetical protein
MRIGNFLGSINIIQGPIIFTIALTAIFFFHNQKQRASYRTYPSEIKQKISCTSSKSVKLQHHIMANSTVNNFIGLLFGNDR